MMKTAYVLMSLGIAMTLSVQFEPIWAIGALYVMLSLWFEVIEPERKRAMRRKDLGDS